MGSHEVVLQYFRTYGEQGFELASIPRKENMPGPLRNQFRSGTWITF